MIAPPDTNTHTVTVTVTVPDAAQDGDQDEAKRHRSYELTIWDKAEHWRFYDSVRAASEEEVRAQFRTAYGRRYRLLGVHPQN